MTSIGWTGGKQVLHRSALELSGDRDSGHHRKRHGEDGAHQSGDDVVFGDACRVIATMDSDFERQLPRLQRM
jgi:hypothetical protein